MRDNQLHHPSSLWHLERTGLEIAILATALLASLHFHWEENKKSILEPRIELGTSCVLGMRDNQLHHPSNFLRGSRNVPPIFWFSRERAHPEKVLGLA